MGEEIFAVCCFLYSVYTAGLMEFTGYKYYYGP